MRILDGALACPARPSAAAGVGRCAGTRVGPVPGPLAALAGTATTPSRARCRLQVSNPPDCPRCRSLSEASAGASLSKAAARYEASSGYFVPSDLLVNCLRPPLWTSKKYNFQITQRNSK